MPERILYHQDGKPTPVVPIFSGGASGWVWLHDHDTSYGRDCEYFTPFGVTEVPDCSGVRKMEDRDTPVLVVEKPEGMRMSEWGDRVVDTIRGELPPDYSMEETLCLLTGSHQVFRGRKVGSVIGNRVVNGHPAPLYVLWHPGTGGVVNAWDLPPAFVKEHYLDRGYRRRYVGWGEDIVPKYLKEQKEWAFSLHIATRVLDHGPIICTKHKKREERHFHDPNSLQDELKDEGDGPGIVAGIHMILGGLEKEGETLYWRGRPLPYQGLNLEPGWEDDIGGIWLNP